MNLKGTEDEWLLNDVAYMAQELRRSCDTIQDRLEDSYSLEEISLGRRLAQEMKFGGLFDSLGNEESYGMNVGMLMLKTQLFSENDMVSEYFADKMTTAVKNRIDSVLDKINQEILDLFGNLLDNAKEACEKIQNNKKWITVKINTQENLMYIHISNSVALFPQKKREGFLSDKSDRNIHGYGLKSVERIVKEHEGIISYDTKGSSFQVGISFFK